jgi:hypothetical protein
LPETLRSLLSRVASRRRLRSIAEAITIGGALFAALLIASSVAIGLTAGVLLAVAHIARRWNTSASALARDVEASHPSLHNLVVTAAELEKHPRPVANEIRDAIFRQAADRAASVDVRRVVPLAQPISVAAAITIGCALLAMGGESALSPSRRDSAGGAAAPSGEAIAVHVAPPAYAKRAAETHANPVQVTVLAGSRVRIESDSKVVREWIANGSESLEFRVRDDQPSRFLSVTVIPDAAPSVRVVEPGRDTAFATPSGTIAIGIESADDLGLVSLALRYTKASGGGENVTFTDGEVPLRIERVNVRQWRARTEWPLDDLALADGDVLVYRAIARDSNPSGSPIESDAFLVEIGRAAEIASAGFALPSEERKYAISQQMVIYKTEQLLASADTNLEESRMIGMEQRMVRAEVVFLSGGEVQDEVEEAAHSHELAEGRLENQGRAEMVRAINFMSRAEAQLNDGNAAAALPLERQALASLERALDRRRYFLRTLPDRSRIDMTRRLTGERREARSWTRDPRRRGASADRLRTVMGELVAASHDPSRVNASLAAHVAAVEPGSAELQETAVGVANAQTPDQQREAVHNAMRALTAHALKTLPGSWPVVWPADPLAGLLGDALTPSRTRR